MDRQTAEHLLQQCHLASINLNAILNDRSPTLSDAEFTKLRDGVGHVLAYMIDYLIDPAITQYSDLNPYQSPA